jgi:hypothetical protein
MKEKITVFNATTGEYHEEEREKPDIILQEKTGINTEKLKQILLLNGIIRDYSEVE